MKTLKHPHGCYEPEFDIPSSLKTGIAVSAHHIEEDAIGLRPEVTDLQRSAMDA